VAGTPFDLRDRIALGPAMAARPPGFDHCFAVRGAPATLRPAAVLDAPATGRWMTVRTDQPGIQLYTGNGLREPFRVHGSVSLETQMFPDTPNRPDLGCAVLRPGEHYGAVTELAFGTGAPPPLDQLVAEADSVGG
jgi:aldose 1-epimerase